MIRGIELLYLLFMDYPSDSPLSLKERDLEEMCWMQHLFTIVHKGLNSNGLIIVSYTVAQIEK